MNNPDGTQRSDVVAPGKSRPARSHRKAWAWIGKQWKRPVVGVLMRVTSVLLILLGIALLWSVSATSVPPQHCVVNSSPPMKVSAAHTPTTLTAVDKRTSDPPTIDFGLARDDKVVAPYSYAVTGAAPDLSTISWDVLLVRGNDEFPTDHVGVRFSAGLGQVHVTVCLKGAGLTAGTYAGGISFVGSTFKAQQLPLTITLKDDNLVKIWMGIVIATGGAVFFKWWSTQVADPNKVNKPDLAEFGRWLRSQWVTVLIGVLGAVGLVYRTGFMTVATFTADDRWKLWTAVFTAVTASTLLVNAVGKAIVEGGNQPPKGESVDASQTP